MPFAMGVLAKNTTPTANDCQIETNSYRPRTGNDNTAEDRVEHVRHIDTDNKLDGLSRKIPFIILMAREVYIRDTFTAVQPITLSRVSFAAVAKLRRLA